MNFNPFPFILTKRLSLREIQLSDAKEILFLRSNKEVTKFIKRPEKDKTKTIDDAIKFIKNLHKYRKNNISLSWSITLKNSDKLIGTICLWNFNGKTAEVGYDLYPNFQKQGIMTEALQSVLKFGFKKLDLETIEAYTHKDNLNSKKLLISNKFTFLLNRKDSENLSNEIYAIDNLSIRK